MVRRSSRGNPNHYPPGSPNGGQFAPVGIGRISNNELQRMEKEDEKLKESEYLNGFTFEEDVTEKRRETVGIDANEDVSWKEVGHDKLGNKIYVHGKYTVIAKKIALKAAMFMGISTFGEYHLIVGGVLLAVYAKGNWNELKNYVSRREHDIGMPQRMHDIKYKINSLGIIKGSDDIEYVDANSMTIQGIKYKAAFYNDTCIGYVSDSGVGDRVVLTRKRDGNITAHYFSASDDNNSMFPTGEKEFNGRTKEAFNFTNKMLKISKRYAEDEGFVLNLKEEYLRNRGETIKIYSETNESISSKEKEKLYEKKKKETIDNIFNNMQESALKDYSIWVQHKLYDEITK